MPAEPFVLAEASSAATSRRYDLFMLRYGECPARRFRPCSPVRPRWTRLLETVDVLSDHQALADIDEANAALNRGDGYTLEEVIDEMGAAHRSKA